MKPKSLVLFDLDGTLLNDNATINSNVYKGLEKLIKNGHLPILASGRSVGLSKVALSGTGIDSYVLLNGQLVNYKGKDIFQGVISQHVISRLYQFVESFDFNIAAYSSQDFKVFKSDKLMEKAYKHFSIIPPDKSDEFHSVNDILMLLLMSDQLEWDRELERLFPELSFYRTSPYSIDIINKHSSKATGIQKIIDLINLPEIPVYAFADSINDIEMVEMADYAIAMGNAVDIIKEKADIVVDTNNKDGIVEGLTYYGLI